MTVRLPYYRLRAVGGRPDYVVGPDQWFVNYMCFSVAAPAVAGVAGRGVVFHLSGNTNPETERSED
ncbi:MAG: hypothetical protein GX971_02870 [Firmicutes bacterium]|nr:hypothetical protein [Bacillota bacterium]